MALGLSAIFGVIRLVNFAHGELMTLAMYAAVVAFQGLALDPFVTMLGAAAVFAAFGYVLQRAFINRFVHRPEHAQMLLMIALSIILANLLLARLRARREERPDELSARFIRARADACSTRCASTPRAAAVLATALLAAFFRLTLTGKAIRACADNPVGARVAGLPVAHLYAVTFGIGAASVAVAGLRHGARSSTSRPRSVPSYTLLAFVIVIVGGLGSMVGALLGGW